MSHSRRKRSFAMLKASLDFMHRDAISIFGRCSCQSHAVLAACERETANERDLLKEFGQAAKELLTLMDSVGTEDGEESDRVFPRYEFAKLRKLYARFLNETD